MEAIVLQKVTKNSLPFGNKKIDAKILGKNGQAKMYKVASKNILAGTIIKLVETFTTSAQGETSFEI